MAALTCEICGGKLIGRPGGIFECDSCGMTYDTAWAKAKVQEIKGTVQVEGTVEVTGKVQIEGGSVKVEGGVNIESLLKRGQLALEDGAWSDAIGYFDEALNLNATCAEAYLGKVCAARTCSDIHKIIEGAGKSIEQDLSFQKVIRFINPETAKKLKEEIRVAEQKLRDRVGAMREKILPAKGLIATGLMHTVGVKVDGSVIAAEGNPGSQVSDVTGWRDIVAVAASTQTTVGLKSNGTVVAVGKNENGQCNVAEWRDIAAIAAGTFHTAGLKKDGTVVAVGNNEVGQCNVEGWYDIVAIDCAASHTMGLKANGTVIGTGAFHNHDVETWEDIIAIADGGHHSVGLKANGTVVAVGSNYYGQCNVAEWRDIVAITAGDEFKVGLKGDGTVVATGKNDFGQCDVGYWRNIIAVDATGSMFGSHTVGLCADGRVESV